MACCDLIAHTPYPSWMMPLALGTFPSFAYLIHFAFSILVSRDIAITGTQLQPSREVVGWCPMSTYMAKQVSHLGVSAEPRTATVWHNCMHQCLQQEVLCSHIGAAVG